MLINSNLNQSNLFINSPLEQFEVTSLISLNAPIFGYLNITLTNLALYSLLILFLIIGLHFLGNNETKLLPSKFLYQLFSGSVLIAIFTLIPFAIFTGLVGLELAVSFIQSFVFCLLVSSYLKDAIDLH